MSAVVQPRPTRLRLLLAGACVVLLALIYAETSQPGIDLPAHVPAARHRTAPPGANEDATFAMPPLDSMAEVLRRPLFSENRRPPAVSVAATEAQATGFTLVGVVMSPHGNRALIEHGEPAHLDHVREQQELDGWTVEKILRDRVVLRHADDRLEVKVKDAPPTAQAGAPVAAPAVAPVPNVNLQAQHFLGGNFVPPPAGR